MENISLRNTALSYIASVHSCDHLIWIFFSNRSQFFSKSLYEILDYTFALCSITEPPNYVS